MPERIDRHPVMAQLISDQGRIDTAVNAALYSPDQIGSPGFINMVGLLDDSPSWFSEIKGKPIKELGRLNSVLLWKGMFENSGFTPIDLGREGLVREVPVGFTMEDAVTSVTRSTGGGFDHVLPLFGLAALMGKTAYRYVEFFDKGRLIEGPVIPRAAEVGKAFGSRSETPEEFLLRLKSLFPPETRYDDNSAMSILLRTGAFRGERRSCPAPRLTQLLLESFGRALEAGFADRMIGSTAVDPKPQVG